MGHTPGPWKAEKFEHVRSNTRHQWFVCNTDGKNIVIFDLSGPNQEANARLIAAAPDLLRVAMELEGLLQYDQFGEYERNRLNEIYQLARAAIAKAEGKDNAGA